MGRRSAAGARLLVAVLFVVLGLIIVGRGLIQGAPLSFTLMGVLMVALGVYRWRLLRTRAPRSR